MRIADPEVDGFGPAALPGDEWCDIAALVARRRGLYALSGFWRDLLWDLMERCVERSAGSS